MTMAPVDPLITSWCSNGNTYTVTTRIHGYTCVEDQQADHDAAVAALKLTHPENC